MPKLYNIYLVNSCPFWLKVEAQMLWACESEKEAEEYAQKEWSEEIEEGNGKLAVHVYEVPNVNGYKVQLVKVNQPRKFYFTFGTSEKYPYQGGWVEVIAPSRHLAFKTFKKHYPNREGSPFINCCDCYESADFKSTDMFTDGNLGAFCHAVIKYEED